MFLGLRAVTTCVYGLSSTMVPLGYKNEEAFLSMPETLFFAGRTGSRSQGGRPQPRWEEGIELARVVKDQRSIHVRGSNSLSIGSRVRAALLSLREGSLHIASIS